MAKFSELDESQEMREMNDRGQVQNTFRMWRLDIAPQIYERVVEAGIDVSIGQKAEKPETARVGPIPSYNDKKGTEPNGISIISKRLSTVPQETGVNISADEPDIQETPNEEAIRSNFRRKHILIGACICIVVMLVIAGLVVKVYYIKPSINTENSKENATATNDIPMITSDVGVNTSEVAVNTKDVGVNTSDVAVNTSEGAVNTSEGAVYTSNVAVNTKDVACFNLKINCITYLVENKITGKIYIKLILNFTTKNPNSQNSLFFMGTPC